MAKKAKQMKFQFDKRGQNSTKASEILKDSKKQWGRIFKEEIRTEKSTSNPDVTRAAKRASKKYKKVKLTWSQALKKASGKSIRKSKSKK